MVGHRQSTVFEYCLILIFRGSNPFLKRDRERELSKLSKMEKGSVIKLSNKQWRTVDLFPIVD